jgi:tetratricopeptide (TPR) repeat protein
VHRSRLAMLVTVAAVAACSTPKDPRGAKGLSEDSALVARVAQYHNTDKQTDKQQFPDACGTFAIPTAAAADTAQARDLAQRGYNAEMLGNLREASSLLRRALELDGADKSAAYHLGRVSEALGEPSPAIRAYCRYLALSPTAAERAEARQRVMSLSAAQSPTPQASQVVAAAPPATRKSARVEPARIEDRAKPARRSRDSQPKHEAHSTTTMASGAVELPTQPNPRTTPRVVERSAHPVVVDSDDVEVERSLPSSDQPRAERREPNRARSAGIGAVAGAIIGGVAGRDAKSAAIGAVAGGILGAVVVRGSRMH